MKRNGVGPRHLLCVFIAQIAALSLPAFAGSLELRETLEHLGAPLLTHTYEGYALTDRILGHPIYSADDIDALVRGLESPTRRELAGSLQERLGRLRAAMELRNASLEEAAHEALSLAPQRASGRIEFIAVSTADSTLRADFVAGAAAPREVVVYLRGDYRRFQANVITCLEALGFRIDPIRRRSVVVLIGHAPETALARLSGIDGVDHLVAQGRPPSSLRPGLGVLHYRRGVKAVVE